MLLTTATMNALAPIGRILFAAIFVVSAPQLFKSEAVAHATAAGVPAAHVLVPLAAILALLGGISVALGVRARLGALALIAFLVPVTLYMHKFWGITDPQQAQMQLVNFMKNLALIGGAAFFVYAGAGAYSIDARLQRSKLFGHPHASAT